MKSLICSLVFIFTVLVSRAQFPIPQNLGSATTLVQVPANGGLKANLINRSYTDTTQANLGYIDYYGAAMIFTTSDSSLWLRNTAGTKWDRVYTSGGSSTTPNLQNVTDVGNTTTNNLIVNSGLGTLTRQSGSAFEFRNTVSGFEHNISVPTVTANREAYLQDTSGTIAYLHDIVGSSGWSLTGNSGTSGNTGASFIGTTDAQKFVTKVNSLRALTINTNLAIGLGTGEDYGTAGWIPQSNGSSTAPTWVNPATLTIPINNLLAATGTNDIDNANSQQVWRWNTLGDNTGLFLLSNSTAALANGQTLLNVQLSGANANINESTRSAVFSNSHTGTNSVNIGVQVNATNATTNTAGVFSATGGTNNYAIDLTGGLLTRGLSSGVITIQPM